MDWVLNPSKSAVSTQDLSWEEAPWEPRWGHSGGYIWKPWNSRSLETPWPCCGGPPLPPPPPCPSWRLAERPCRSGSLAMCNLLRMHTSSLPAPDKNQGSRLNSSQLGKWKVCRRRKVTISRRRVRRDWILRVWTTQGEGHKTARERICRSGGTSISMYYTRPLEKGPACCQDRSWKLGESTGRHQVKQKWLSHCGRWGRKSQRLGSAHSPAHFLHTATPLRQTA